MIPALAAAVRDINKCCLGKDALSNNEDNSMFCYECKKPILIPEHSCRFGAGDGKEICFCSVCYGEMSCSDCGRKLGLQSFTMHWCPDGDKIHIECRKCIIDRIKRQRNIPHWQKIKVRGLMRRSRRLIKISLAEELTPEKIFGQGLVIEN